MKCIKLFDKILTEKLYTRDNIIQSDGRGKVTLFTIMEIETEIDENCEIYSVFTKSDLKRIWSRLFQSGFIQSTRGDIDTDQLRDNYLRIVNFDMLVTSLKC